MKFNLKNRPLLVDSRKSVEEMNDWFEGFEKELREMHETACGYEQHVTQCAVRATLKEILGE